MDTNQFSSSFNTSTNRFYTTNRKISFGVILKIWFGNILTFLGLAFIIMGLPFAIVFISFSSLFQPSFSEKDPVSSAVITNSMPGNSYINDVQVHEYLYEYKAGDGKLYTGKGYSTGNIFRVGDEISIQFKADNAGISKAKELRTSEFGGGLVLLVLIFPLIGIIMLIFSIRKTYKLIYILKIGELAEGKLLSKVPTNVRINNQTVYELIFEFTAFDGNIYQASTKTHQYHRLEDEQLEKLVYNPEKPSNAVLLDALPKGLKEFFLQNF